MQTVTIMIFPFFHEPRYKKNAKHKSKLETADQRLQCNIPHAHAVLQKSCPELRIKSKIIFSFLSFIYDSYIMIHFGYNIFFKRRELSLNFMLCLIIQPSVIMMEPFEFEVSVSMLHPTDDIFSAYLDMILTLVIFINHLNN